MMALPKKGLRKLEHRDIEYGWIIRKKPTYMQAAFYANMTLAIQSLDTDSPKVLHVTLNIDRPDNWMKPHQTQITPQIIKNIIDKANKKGWDSEAGGKAYEFIFSVVKHT